MLGEGREFLTTYLRVAVLPGLVILVLVVGINLFGDALRDQLDPRLRDRRRGLKPRQFHNRSKRRAEHANDAQEPGGARHQRAMSAPRHPSDTEALAAQAAGEQRRAAGQRAAQGSERVSEAQGEGGSAAERSPPALLVAQGLSVLVAGEQGAARRAQAVDPR